MQDKMPPSPRRRPLPGWARWTALSAAGLAGLALAMLLAARLLIASDWGRDLVERQVERRTFAGQAVRLEGLEGDLLGAARIGQITIADADGIWLRIDGLSINWSPLALLTQTLRIETLAADRVDVVRRPDMPERPARDRPREETALPSGRLALDTLRIGTLDLGPALLGTPDAVRLRIDAGGRASLARGDLTASVIPLSGRGDRLEADLAWTSDTPLTGRVRVDGPAGGLFARLARLDADQAVAATFDGRLTESGWDATGDLTLGEARALTFDGMQTGASLRLTAQVRPGTHPLGALAAARLGGRVDLVLERNATGQTLHLEAPNLTLDADAPSDPLFPRTADLVLATRDPARLTGVEVLKADRLTYRGTLDRRPGGVLDLSGTLDARDLAVSDIAAARISGPLTLGYDPNAGRIESRLSLSADGLTAPGTAGRLMGATPTVSGEVTLDPGERVLRLDQAVLRTPALVVSASGATASGLASPAFSGRLSLDGRTASLAPIHLDAGWEMTGASLATPRLSLEGTVFDYPDLPAPLARLAAREARFDLDLDIQAGGGLDVPRLRAESGSVQLGGRASRTTNGEVILDLEGHSGPVTAHGVQTGPLSVHLQADGPLNRLAARLTLRTPDLAAQGLSLTAPVLSLTGRQTADGWRGDVSFEAASQAGPLSLAAGYGLEGSAWSIDNARLDGPSVEGRANLSGVGGDPRRFGGRFSLQADPVGLPVLGQVEADGRLSSEAIDVTAGAELTLPGTGKPTRLDLTGSGTPDTLALSLKASGETAVAGLTQPIRLDLKANGEGLTGPDRRVELSGDAALGDLVLAMREPLSLRQTPDGWTGKGRFDLAGGRLDLDLAARAAGPRLDARLSEVRLAPVLALAGQPPLAGTVSGDLDVSASDLSFADPRGTTRLTLDGLQRPGNADDPPADIALDLRLGADRMEADLTARDRTGLAIDVAGEVPLARADGERHRLDGPIAYRATGGGPVDSLLALVLPANVDAGGRLDIDVSGHWPADGTGLDGRLDLIDGRLEQGDAGFRLEALTAGLRLQPNRFELVTLSASDGAGGQLTGQGTYVPSGSGNTLTLSARSLRLADRRDVSATASGDVRLEDTPEGFSLAGNLTIDRADINLDALPGAGLTTLDVRFDDAGKRDGGDTDTRTRLALDLVLKAPRRVFLQGQGLDAELSLSAAITGPVGAPRIEGQADIVRGRFDLAGKRFAFRESLVRFDGDPMAAVLDIQAVRETDTLTAIVEITGTPLRPQIALKSQPDVPEDEVLSRVLFGRSPAQLSALETARLAGALGQLAGGGGLNLTGSLEDALGLDALDFGRTASGVSELTTGKYLAENVYLEVRTGAEGQPGVAVEWRPRRNIEVEADLKPAEGQELSIQWTRDFD